MPINSAGLKFIEEMEGFSPTPYQCQAGKWTIGFGHTQGVGPNDLPQTREQAETQLLLDLGEFEDDVLDMVSIELTDNELTALVSFALNEGAHRLQKSDLLRKVNDGDIIGASKEFSKYCYYHDPKTGSLVVSTGLASRRSREAALFVSDQIDKKDSVTEC